MVSVLDRAAWLGPWQASLYFARAQEAFVYNGVAGRGKGGGGGVGDGWSTPMYELCGYVSLRRVWFSGSLGWGRV